MSEEEEFCCSSCFDEIDNNNMVKYKVKSENKQWLISNYCENCVHYVINTSWKIFTDSVEKADCKKSLQKILDVGPPINIRDKVGFPDPNNKETLTEIHSLLFCRNNTIQSAKLKGSLTGIERNNYIKLLENFKFD